MTPESAKNLINYIKILKKIKSTPEKIKRYQNSMDGFDKNGKSIIVEF